MPRFILPCFIAFTFATFLLLRSPDPDHTHPTHAPNTSPVRIISLAPSITETLFALDLNDRIAGVTKFCDYPDAACDKPRIGGYYDPNFERIIELQPDLIITLPEHAEDRDKLSQLNTHCLTVDHSTTSGILQSITDIGQACNTPKQAELLRRRLSGTLDQIRTATNALPRPRVLVSLGSPGTDGPNGRITICGPGSIYDELLTIAGGTNAYQGDVPYPQLSGDGLASLAPDIIVDMVSDMEGTAPNRAKAREAWESLPALEAIENEQVHILTADYLTVPGPRFVLLVQDLARIMHPNALTTKAQQ